jgi:hypothetical protein
MAAIDGELVSDNRGIFPLPNQFHSLSDLSRRKTVLRIYYSIKKLISVQWNKVRNTVVYIVVEPVDFCAAPAPVVKNVRSGYDHFSHIFYNKFDNFHDFIKCSTCYRHK